MTEETGGKTTDDSDVDEDSANDETAQDDIENTLEEVNQSDENEDKHNNQN